LKKKNILIFTLILLFLIGGNLPLGIYKAKAATSNVINFNFIPVDSIIDPNRPDKDNSLVSLNKLSDNTVGAKVINLVDDSLQFKLISSYPEQGDSKAPVQGYMIFQFNQIVNIDTSKAILGDCTIKNYVTYEKTIDNQLILYYDKLNYNTKYTVKLNADALKDSSGNPLSEDYNLSFTTGAEFDRLYGGSRYETSVEISKFGASHADYVVLATGEDFPDALCAAPLATKYEAPILLTHKSSLPTVVENEINRLKPKEVFLVGGSGVISDNIKTVLQNKGIKVTRISGPNRYETSLEVAKYVNSTKQEVFVVTGENYPDALSIGAYAGNKQIPILLTDKNKLPDKINNFIKSKGITKAYVIGGSGVVGNSVVSSLPNAERIYGSNRYETNIEVLARFEFFFGETYFATGESFADALSGAALAGAFNNPIVLVSDSMPNDIVEMIKENKDMMKMKKILGGPGAVSDSIINRIFK
jgi:putative cell wall-binding protein